MAGSVAHASRFSWNESLDEWSWRNWEVDGNLLIFTIRADRFLRNMVRAIVGTMIELGKHKITLEDFEGFFKTAWQSEGFLSREHEEKRFNQGLESLRVFFTKAEKENILPKEIEKGIKDVSKRSEWNKPATINYALPTEIWREVIDRRNHYTEVKTKIDKGEITAMNHHGEEVSIEALIPTRGLIGFETDLVNITRGLGVMSHLLPGYLGIPTESEPDLKTYLEKRTPKPMRPGQMDYWQNYPKFIVSLLKAWYGAAATKEPADGPGQRKRSLRRSFY